MPQVSAPLAAKHLNLRSHLTIRRVCVEFIEFGCALCMPFELVPFAGRAWAPWWFVRPLACAFPLLSLDLPPPGQRADSPSMLKLLRCPRLGRAGALRQ